MFLSTPPSRVATKPAFFLGCEDVVSIHATLAGGDSASRCRPRRTARVSIHATLAGGDWRRRHERKRICVSIHATLAGGDHKLLCHRPAVLVSIHATLAGGDSAETLVMSIYQQKFRSTGLCQKYCRIHIQNGISCQNQTKTVHYTPKSTALSCW